MNLALEIVGRRPDGFHELVSVTQTISLHDTIEARNATTLAVEMEPPVVAAEENLVGRAASLLASAAGLTPAARIVVRKRIPLAAGLGGGSSDAAATLRLLDRLWRTGLPPNRLASIAATLGSDVPLFLTGGAALIRGRGEVVEALPPPPTFWLSLACLGFEVAEKTRALYRALAPVEWTNGRSTLSLAHWIRLGNPVPGARLINTFDGPAARVYPRFADLRAQLAEAAGAPLHLTGAGPSLFALFATRAEAEAAARRMRRPGVQTAVARSVQQRPAIRAMMSASRAREGIDADRSAASPTGRATAPRCAGWPGAARRAPGPGCTPR